MQIMDCQTMAITTSFFVDYKCTRSFTHGCKLLGLVRSAILVNSIDELNNKTLGCIRDSHGSRTGIDR